MTTQTRPWTIRIDAATVLWRGRRLRVHVTLSNIGAAAAIPEPRRLRPTLRDVHGHALATAEVMRLEGQALTIFRPVVPPGSSVQVCLQFERLPPDRTPFSITFGELDTWLLSVPLVAPPAASPITAHFERETP